MQKPLYIFKIGGKLLDDETALLQLVQKLSELSHPFVLVHGGGSQATRLAEQLGIPQQMVNGRRITDTATLDLALMCYAGLINKKLVATFQGMGRNCLGLSGADANSIVASKRVNAEIDFGWVGDPILNRVNTAFLSSLIEQGIAPVFCALTHDGKGQMLNTNADTMAQCIAIALSGHYQTSLIYLFEKPGVLRDVSDDKSLITALRCADLPELISNKSIHDGMIPKLENACVAIRSGVSRVVIGSANSIDGILKNFPDAATYVYS